MVAMRGVELASKSERGTADETVTLKSGDKVPVLGLGTWRMGERKSERAAEVAAISWGSISASG